jgi:hypothetical protein
MGIKKTEREEKVNKGGEGRIKGRAEKKNAYGSGVSRNGKRRKHKKEKQEEKTG